MAEHRDAEGRLRLTLGVGADVIESVRIDSTRPTGVSRALVGRSVRDAVGALPLIYSRCGLAQCCAGLAAAEDALDIVPAPERVAARALLVLSESTRENAWRVLLDWPRVCGRPLALEALVSLRVALQRLERAVFEGKDWRNPGAGRVASAHAERCAGLAELDALLRRAVVGEDVDPERVLASVPDFEHWYRGAPTPAAGVLRAVADRGLAGFGHSDVAPLPDLARDWLEAKLAADGDGAFLSRPTLEGEPRETGPLARCLEVPLLAALAERHGNGLLTRMAARLVELLAAPRRMRSLCEGLARGGVASPASTAGRHDGVGIGIVENARGRLVHRIEVTDDRVVRYQVLAPTEWNFHPDGPLARGLRGAPVSDPDHVGEHVELLVTALDPCVECDTHIEPA